MIFNCWTRNFYFWFSNCQSFFRRNKSNLLFSCSSCIRNLSFIFSCKFFIFEIKNIYILFSRFCKFNSVFKFSDSLIRFSKSISWIFQNYWQRSFRICIWKYQNSSLIISNWSSVFINSLDCQVHSFSDFCFFRRKFYYKVV